MSIISSGQFNEVDDTSYLSTSATITTSASELKVGASRLSGRQNLIVFNKGSSTIYIGPSGVTSSTGIPVEANQMFSYPFGQNIAVYAITSSGSSTVIIQEVG